MVAVKLHASLLLLTTVFLAVWALPIKWTNNHYYEKVALSPPVNWTTAKLLANSRTYSQQLGYLATVKTQEENAFIAANFFDNTNDHIAMAASQRSNILPADGFWRWEVGPEQEMVFYSNGCESGWYCGWHPGVPDNIGGVENCGEFVYVNGQWGWNDNRCSSPIYTHMLVEYSCIKCSYHGSCQDVSGCVCDTGYGGTHCGRCVDYYYGYPDCTLCTKANTCNNHGTCIRAGACLCDKGFNGTNCEMCASGYYGYPNCQLCSRATTCNGHGNCGATSCVCDDGFVGERCDSCAPGFFGYPSCTACSRDGKCNGHGNCDATGQCVCDAGFGGSNCGSCAANYYSYPTCTYCTIDSTCNGNGNCDASGQCVCDAGFTGMNCDSCIAGYGGYPNCADVNECLIPAVCGSGFTCVNSDGSFSCQECSRAGTCNGNGDCDASGQCVCDSEWSGEHCESCAAQAMLDQICGMCESMKRRSNGMIQF